MLGYVREEGLISGSGWSPGEVHGNPFQYSCLENTMDREAWGAKVHRIVKSCIPGATNTFTFIITQPGFDHWEDPLEKEMATHSSILAWRIPWRILLEKIPWPATVHGVSRVRYDLEAKQSPPPKQILGKLAIIDISSFYFSFDSYLRRNFWIFVYFSPKGIKM